MVRGRFVPKRRIEGKFPTGGLCRIIDGHLIPDDGAEHMPSIAIQIIGQDDRSPTLFALLPTSFSVFREAILFATEKFSESAPND